MKERPIIFSAPMVRAILEGKKTQTRRIMKHQVCEPGIVEIDSAGYCMIVKDNGVKIQGWHCPYGKVGEKLWVRETWSKAKSPGSSHIFYRSDGDVSGKQLAIHYIEREKNWRPSVFMPRHASRITLEITGVRVERLNDISEEDSIAEGCDESKSDSAISQGWYEKPRRAFMRRWEFINGAGSWAKNPWVWVIEFKRV